MFQWLSYYYFFPNTIFKAYFDLFHILNLALQGLFSGRFPFAVEFKKRRERVRASFEPVRVQKMMTDGCISTL